MNSEYVRCARRSTVQRSSSVTAAAVPGPLCFLQGQQVRPARALSTGSRRPFPVAHHPPSPEPGSTTATIIHSTKSKSTPSRPAAAMNIRVQARSTLGTRWELRRHLRNHKPLAYRRDCCSYLLAVASRPWESPSYMRVCTHSHTRTTSLFNHFLKAE